MSNLHYITPSRDEVLNLGIISVIFSFLFSFIFIRFDGGQTLFNVFFVFFIFLFILFILRLFIMKFFGLRNAFEINLELSYFDRFGFSKYDKLSFYKKFVEDKVIGTTVDVTHKIKGMNKGSYHTSTILNKGLPIIFLSVFFYILTLGTFIYPSVFQYKIKKIPHLFLGSQQKHEIGGVLFFYNIDISDYRISKALFFGFFYYFVFGLFLKLFFSESFYYYWMIFILFWIALVSLMPIPGSEGFDLFRKNSFAWIMAITILILGLVGILVFNSVEFMLFVLGFSFIVIMFVVLWRKIMR